MSHNEQDVISQHAHEFRRCVASDLFNVSGEDCDEKRKLIADTDEYLSAFVAPIKEDGKTVCFHCGAQMDGMMHALGFGAAYAWGLAHGEAHCSKCQWPARGMHYPKDGDGKELWTARNLFLAYHPDFVEQSK
jgi:hypothetical protein